MHLTVVEVLARLYVAQACHRPEISHSARGGGQKQQKEQKIFRSVQAAHLNPPIILYYEQWNILPVYVMMNILLCACI